MTDYYDNSPNENMIGTAGNDLFYFSQYSPISGSSVEGEGGIDTLVTNEPGYTGNTNIVDFRQLEITNVSAVEFDEPGYVGSPASPTYQMIFNSTQFGVDALSNYLNISSYSTNGTDSISEIIVDMSTAGTFSAANWTFSSWYEGDIDEVYLNGSPGADTISAPTVGAIMTGGGGADTFVISASVGINVVTDFTPSDGDRIDLSTVAAVTDFADIQANAVQSGASTVITIGSGKLTLDNTQAASLVASDFIFRGTASATVQVTSPYTVNAGQKLAFTGSDGVQGAYDVHGSASLTINGSILVQDSSDNNPLSGIYVEENGLTASITIASGASVTVISQGANSTAYGLLANEQVNFENDGTFSVTAGQGVVLPQGGSILNTGTISVAGPAALFIEAPMIINNSGSITIDGTRVIDAEYFGGGTIINSGTMAANAWNSAALFIGDSTPGKTETVINSGTIFANAAAIYAASNEDPGYSTTNLMLTNTGSIIGQILLADGAGSQIVNAGAIDGAVHLGTTGNDVYDGRGGTQAGGIYLGGGADIVYLGADGETAYGGSGSAVIVGGSGADTITGGTGNDVIAGGSGNDTLTGGTGADMFAFSPGSGADVITDFTHTQGDRVNLSAFANLHGLIDVESLLSQSGSNTVLALPGGGSVTLDNVTASSLTASDFVFGASSADFTADGLSNAVWQNASGAIAVWAMNGSALYGSVLSTAAPGWQLEDTGDFNGDGLSGDLLFRNPTTGQVAIWEMNGTQIVSAAIVASVPAAWSVEGTGDFNGDGKSDIVLHDGATGQVAIWEMNGTSIAASAIVATAPVAWSLVGSGDFNGDGKSDLLWENGSTGQLAIWEMNGLTIASAGNVITVPTGWHVEGTGDFDGDGRSDIVLESASGQVAIWEMNGMSIAGAAIVATPGSAWQVAQVGDFNGDGKADILLHDAATGQNAVWDMNGTAIASAALLPNVDASWTALNHHYDWV